LSEDFLATDHRPLGWRHLDAVQFVAWYPPMIEQRPDVQWGIGDEHLGTEHVVCVDVVVGGGASGADHDPGGFDIPQTVVATARDGRLTSMELYDQAERDTAIAHARDLSAELDA
jgi:hypothetical protein